MNQIPVIETKGLSIGYRSLTVADNINISLGSGELIAVIGRNGCGKSTFFRTLSARQRPLGGQIKIEGRPVESIKRKELAKLISLVVTDRGDDTLLTARETVELGRHPHTGFLGRLSPADTEAVEQAMKKTGCSAYGSRYISELSDGERQKTAIARALAQDTPIMLLDEPFSFIDVAARLELTNLLKHIARDQKKTILFSTHDVTQAFRYADRLVCFTTDKEVSCLIPSEAVVSGIADRLFTSDNVRFDSKDLNYYLLSGAEP